MENQPAQSANPELAKVDEILNNTVRPYLKSHGGNLELIDLKNNVLKIHYQGACGSCPSATFGTLQAVQNVLREKYSPEITVQTV